MLGVEKKSALQLQDPRTVRKVALLDDHICIAFAGMVLFHHFGMSVIDCAFHLTFSGLTADGRILIDKARVECQSHRLTVEDPVSVEYITKFVAGVQQVSYTILESTCTLLRLMPFSEIHSIRWCSSIWYLNPYRRIRSRRLHTAPVPDRTQWNLLGMESQRDRSLEQNRAGILGEELQGGLGQG